MTGKNEMLERLKQTFKNGKITQLFLIAGVFCVLAIIFFPIDNGADESLGNTESSETSYNTDLTHEIAGIVSAITGEKSPHVTVTLRTSGETVYATEDRKSEKNTQEYFDSVLNKSLSDGDTETKYIILKNSDGSQKPLIVTQKQPEVLGVVIVSQFGNNALIREKITLAVKTALNLSSTQVCVTGQAEYT